MGRKRAGLLAGLTLAVLVLALLFAFGRTLFLDTAEVRLPEKEGSQGSQSGETPGETGGATSYRLVEVDEETVQAVIASLARPQSYDREISIETYWGADSYGVTKVHAWADGGYTRIQTELPGGGTRNVITGDDRFYLWYDGDTGWFECSAREREDDISQQIPTYEDVLALPKERILEAGYVTLSGIDCIYIEISEDSLGYLERYWVSVETGLLVCSETETDGRVVYRMTSFTVNIPFVGEDVFTLPDGTDLLQTPQAAPEVKAQ